MERPDVDKFFAERGATQFSESFYPPKQVWTYANGTQWITRVFSVHYFNDDAEEIGYWIPDLAEWGAPHIFETPRLWPEGHEENLTVLYPWGK